MHDLEAEFVCLTAKPVHCQKFSVLVRVCRMSNCELYPCWKAAKS